MDRLLSDFRLWLSDRLPCGVMRAVRPFLTVQFIIFMLMGIINTAISVSAATILDMLHASFLPSDSLLRTMSQQFRINFILGYMISIITSFFLNCKFTFHEKPTLRKFLKFPVSYIPNFIFQYIFVIIFTAMHRNQTLAYICAAIIGTPITFAAMKLIVFGRNKSKHRKQRRT